jgi:SAM-dependent methyltransferase
VFSIPAFDDLSTENLAYAVHEWVQEQGPTSTDLVAIDQAWNLFLPRTVFLKSLPTASTILDVGAGDGGMAIFKQWPLVQRPDLRLFALSLEIGERFDLYEAFEIKNFEDDPNIFGDQQFDAVVCAHFIEHMSTPRGAIEFFARKLRSGGRLYLEWPHPLAKRIPSRSAIVERGSDIGTTNFFDDDTHVDAWPAEQLIKLLEENGFAIESGGRVYLPWIAEQMRNHALADKDKTRLTLAFWAAFGWAQYLVLNRL